jgi:hypothetical protein
VNATDDSPDGLCFSPERDRRNRRRVHLWALLWAASFIGTSLGIAEHWFSIAVTVAGVILVGGLGFATVVAYHRFLQATDELRRKIEVEALALAYGVGMVGGLCYWLLVVSGTAPALGFAYVFAGTMLLYTAGVLIGRQRYS